MSESEVRKVEHESHRNDVWGERVVPAARAFERFFWNLLWFAVLVCLLFSYNPFR